MDWVLNMMEVVSWSQQDGLFAEPSQLVEVEVFVFVGGLVFVCLF